MAVVNGLRSPILEHNGILKPLKDGNWEEHACLSCCVLAVSCGCPVATGRSMLAFLAVRLQGAAVYAAGAAHQLALAARQLPVAGSCALHALP